MYKRAIIFILFLLFSALPVFAGIEEQFDPVEKRLIEEQRLEMEMERAKRELLEREREAEARKKMRKKVFSSVDITGSVNNLSPGNGTFADIGGGQAISYYSGIDVSDVLDIGLESGKFSEVRENTAGITEVNFTAVSLTLSYPVSLGRYFLIYAGGGGRFEELALEGADVDGIVFGNNAALLTGGIKLKFSAKRRIGIDANYSRSLASTYTDYDIFRVGMFYGWSL